MIDDEDWLRRMAQKEDGCIVSAGGLVTEIEKLEKKKLICFAPCSKEEADTIVIGNNTFYRLCRVEQKSIGFYVAPGPGDIYVRWVEAAE